MNKHSYFRLLVIALIIVACDDSSSSPKPEPDLDLPEQKPTWEFIHQDSIILVDTRVNSGSFEFGTRMRFIKNGHIDSIGIQMPDSDSYRFTVWNLADTSIVLSTQIDVDSGEVKYMMISPIEIQAGDEIRITIQSNDWYRYTHTTNSTIQIFPDTIGDIILIDYGYFDGNSQSYPTEIYQNYYAGFADIVFKPTE
ncbi:MAG: hypothetical protein KDD94_01605 [Calditrichaeota bacterium]|nr:hypothetical protein [Calditrichota bacterium]